MNRKKTSPLFAQYSLLVGVVILALFAFYRINRENPLLFHSLAEMFGIGVAGSIFTKAGIMPRPVAGDSPIRTISLLFSGIRGSI